MGLLKLWNDYACKNKSKGHTLNNSNEQQSWENSYMGGRKEEINASQT